MLKGIHNAPKVRASATLQISVCGRNLKCLFDFVIPLIITMNTVGTT